MDNFKKYPSLINVEHVKDIAWWLENYPDLKSETYVVREKIDGANLQIVFLPDGSMRVGRRTDWLKDDEKFFDYQGAIERSPDLIAAFKVHAERCALPIRAYFELYGGRINRRVKYGNDGLNLCLLDIAHIIDEDNIMYCHQWLENFAMNNKIEHYLPPKLGEFGIDEGMSFDLTFDSKILGIPSNQAEGIVIIPKGKVYYNARGERFVLKAKHPKFEERKEACKPREPATPEQLLFASYLNENRLLSVFSKHGNIESIKQLGNYIKLVMNDAKEDFKREHPEIDALNKDIFTLGGKIVAPLLKAHL